MRYTTVLLACCSTLFGCAPDDERDAEASDAEAANFASGKADGGTPEDGSALALGVLRLANEASFETLDDPVADGGVGLDRRAAAGIVERREVAPFDRLEDLDAVPYVGPVALSRLVDFALEHDFVEPVILTGSLSTDIAYRGCNSYPSTPTYCHASQNRLVSTEVELEEVDGEQRIRGRCESAFGAVEFDEALPLDDEELVVVTYTFEYGSVSDRTQSCIYTPRADGSIEVIFDWTAYTYASQSWRQGTAEGTIEFD